MQELESCFKITTNWDEYQTKATKQAQNQYLDYLIDQGINRLSVLSFESNFHKIGDTGYFRTKKEIKDYPNVMDERNFFDQPSTSAKMI